MSTSVFHRRRAERLAQLLDEASGGPRRHQHSALNGELAGYVRLSDGLCGAAGLLPDPTPEFRSSLRAMLVATAERDGIGRTATDAVQTGGKRARSRPPVLSSRRARGAILVGLAAGTLALSGMSAASTNAMPGDPLYGVKRSTESARLALAGSPVSKGQLYLEFARNRLTEARGTKSPDAGMFDDMDSDTRAGVKLLTAAAATHRDATALDIVDGFVRTQHADLAGLGDGTRVRQSLALLDRVARRSADLRDNLGCAAGATGDDLGPVAQSCHPPTKSGPTHSGAGTGTGTAPTSGPGPNDPSEPATTPGTGATSPGPSPTPGPSGLLNHLIHGVI